MGESAWFDIEGTSDGKWSPEEGEFVLSILRELKEKEVFPDVYIVSPFKEVADNLEKLILKSKILDSWVPCNSVRWVKERVGTVHRVQGLEAEAVILVLGAPSKAQNGARRWAGSKANILNVAVTRAKESLYVIGNAPLWKEAGVFSTLYEKLKVRDPHI